MSHNPPKALLWAGLAAIAVCGAVLYEPPSLSGAGDWSGGETIVIKPRLGDRLFVASVLESVFGPNDEARVIANRLEIFGGFCDPYEKVRISPEPEGVVGGAGDCAERGAYQPTEQTPTSVVRQGYLIRACDSLVARKQTMAHAMANLPGREIDRESLTAAFQLFFPERIPGEAVIESLREISGTTTLSRWQKVFKVLCSDPGWQSI
jgi:hypothetical protein